MKRLAALVPLRWSDGSRMRLDDAMECLQLRLGALLAQHRAEPDGKATVRVVRSTGYITGPYMPVVVLHAELPVRVPD